MDDRRSTKTGLMLDRNLLNGLSRSFADSLCREFSEWEQFGELLPDSDEGGAAMKVTVKQTGTDRALQIRTDDGEITIGFDMWHTHLGAFMGISDSASSEKSVGHRYAPMGAGSSARAAREPDVGQRGSSFSCSQPVAFRTVCPRR
jgi:hypothetical protein